MKREQRAINKRVWAQCFLFVLLFLGLVTFAQSAHAATGLKIQPVKISYRLVPGQTVQGTVLLSNASADDVQVDMHVEDFVPVAGADTIQFVGRSPGVTTVKDWVALGNSQTFTFKKDESKEIPYTITVPQNAEPGSHFGVALFKAIRTADLNAQLKIGTQVGMLIFITVPGNHLEKGRILDFSAPTFVQQGPVDFTMKFENTGTVHFEPTGQIVITNMFGKQVATVPIGGEVVLPTGIKKIDIPWNVAGILIGQYHAKATVIDGDGNILTTKEVSFFAFPLWYLLYFIITLIVLYIILKLIRKYVKISIKLN